MRISKPKIFQQKSEILFRVVVEFTEGPETLWYSLNHAFGDLVSDSCDAPLVALLIPAMANGEDIHVTGAISERLLYNLSGSYQRLLQYIIPSLHRVEIHPEEVHTRTVRASGVATGFSGGIDSYCVLADYCYSDVPEAFKITHLLFNNVGSHGKGGERLFRERYARLNPVAEHIGLPFVMVNSNVDAFYKKGLGFEQTHTVRNLSVALLLQGGIGRYMYASGFSFKDVFVGATYDMAYSDTIALPLLSTETLDAFSVGSEYTRIEKTLRVANLCDSYDTLDVCVNADHTQNRTNCSTCWKCMRTLLSLDICGVVERYSASFNLDVYKQRKSKYIGQVLMSRYPLLRELVQFATARGYSFPFLSHLYARINYPVSQIKRIAKILIRAARRWRTSIQNQLRT